MKKLLLVLIFLPFVSYAQVTDVDLKPYPIPELIFDSNEILFREVMQFEGSSKELHSLALKAVSELYRSSKSVTDVNDSENGNLIVKGTLPLTINSYYLLLGAYKPMDITYTMDHVLSIESKENRIRVTIDRFKFSSATTAQGTYVFESDNNLDKSYVEMFKKGLETNKPKKRDVVNTYNQSLVLNELNTISLAIIEKVKEVYDNSKNDDW